MDTPAPLFDLASLPLFDLGTLDLPSLSDLMDAMHPDRPDGSEG